MNHNLTAHIKRLTAVLIAALSLLVLSAAAQEDTPEPETIPSQIDLAMGSLSQRLREDVTFETLAGFEWERRQFNDASLGCAEPGQNYAQVVTPGYKFLLTYAGTTYDFRVSEDGETVKLCDTRPALPAEPTPPDPGGGTSQPCDNPYVVQPDETLAEIATKCNSTIDELMTLNSEIREPSLIYAGQELRVPAPHEARPVSISPTTGPAGTTITIRASGFPPGAMVELGLGRYASEYDVYATREVGQSGELRTQLPIPQGADPEERWVAVVVLNNVEYVSGVFTVTEGQNTPTLTPTLTPLPEDDTAIFEWTDIYLVALEDAGRSGIEIGCGDSLVPVEVQIKPTVAPLTAALENLLAINTRTYGQSGLHNALHRADLTVESVDIDNGEAQIQLSGDIQAGGVCDVPRIEGQLRQTALQYSTVDSVSIMINGQPLEDIMSAR